MAKQRYFLKLSYLGTRYRGYQIQADKGNIQGHLENALSSVFQEELTTVCCGRTDAGVHAEEFYLHLDAEVTADKRIIYKLNKNLPEDIAVHGLFEVDQNMHARFDALSRTYHYYFHTKKNVGIHDQSTWISEGSIKADVMKEAISKLRTVEDFRGFCKTPDRYPHTRCKVMKLDLFQNESGTQFCLELKANRFVRGMIRNIMAQLFLLSKDKITWEDFHQRCVAKHSMQLPIPAPPQGLHLSGVEYASLPYSEPQKKLLSDGEKWILV